MGRLVADPELRQTPNGVAVCTFRLAVDRDYTKEKQADFIDIVAWRQTAEFVSRYFSKGKLALVEGSLQTRSYEVKNGNRRTAVEVVADRVRFGEPKAKAEPDERPLQQAGPADSNGVQAGFEQVFEFQDMPF